MDKWNAKEYRKNSQNQYRWGKELVEKARIRKGENVLDIGCGDGKITAVIAKKAASGQVIGVDSSAKMLSLARKLFPASSYRSLSFTKADARKMRFNACFDVVFSNACLHWIKDQEKVLECAGRAMKPGARIFFQLGGKGNAGQMNRLMTRLTKSKRWKKYFRGFKFPYFFPSPSEYSALLRKSGLKPVKVFLVPKIAEHKGAPGLFAWLKTTWLPYTHRVPVKHRNTFIEQATEMYIKATKQAGKTIIKMPMMRLQVEAVKPGNALFLWHFI